MDDVLDVVTGGWGLALGIGIGAALLVGRGMRPLAKTAIKGYLAASDGIRQATEGAREEFQDIYAEAKAERETKAQPQAPATSAPQV
ncbi:MAG TPA: DUF5132 domain-containing protein [Chloroflexota bacterium]|nr:DUF5132 domain-containing protein [Chloroflexota bacterium]